MEGNTVMDKDALSFWNSRAALGLAAGSNDVIAKQLEIDALASYAKDGLHILDFGCGNGVTALELARRYRVNVLGIDYAEEMISAAQALAGNTRLRGSVRFCVGDVGSLQSIAERFDMVYTERMIINLKGWAEQSCSIASLTNLLAPGGLYAMCENSEDGLQAINALRRDVGLGPISAPWHNRYLKDDEVAALTIPGVSLEDVNCYSSTYYFLSRVINAALAAREGLPPAYDAPLNQLALALPPLDGRLAQGRIWAWRKIV